MLNTLKERIRQQAWLYQPIRARRSRRQENEFVRLREHYYQRCPVVSSQSPLLRLRQPPKETSSSLRIFVVVSHDWEHRTLTPVVEHDFDAEIFDYGSYVARSHDNLSSWRADLQRDLKARFDQAHARKPFDLVFAYGSHFHFDPATLQHMRDCGAPVALMWLDDKHAFLPKTTAQYSGQKPLIGAVDVHLTNSIECVRWYQAEGTAAFYFPEGCNPALGADLQLEKCYDVSFVGKNYGARSAFVAELRRQGVHVECFGPGWKNGPVPDEDMPRIFRQSWINLGFGGVMFSDQITCLKGRDFDVPAAGSAYLTTFDPELAWMFDIGREILCYRNAFDAVETIHHYLGHKDQLEAVGRAARERCLRQHTWTQRIIDLSQWMGILVSRQSQ